MKLRNVLMGIIMIVLIWIFIVALVVILSSPPDLVPTPEETEDTAGKIAKGILNPLSLIENKAN